MNHTVAKVLKAVGVSCIGLTVLFVAQLIRWHRQANKTFEKYSRELEAAVQPARERERPPLFYPELSGDAWSSYEGALPALQACLEKKCTWPVPQADEYERLLIDSRPILEGVRAALSRRTLKFPKEPTSLDRDVPSFLRGYSVAHAIFVPIAEGLHSRHLDGKALETLILLLGISLDVREAPGDGLDPTLWGSALQFHALNTWFRVLKEHNLELPEIIGITNRLDQLSSSRSSVFAGLVEHKNLWQSRILQWERQGIAEFPMGRRPSWRFVFSASLTRAATLDRMELVWQRIKKLEDYPSEKWMQELDLLIVNEDFQALEAPLEHVIDAIRQEVELLRLWLLARLAIAIVKFEAQVGGPPESISDLSPGFLSVPPLCPRGGERLFYKDGRIGCDHSKSGWIVSRMRR